MTVSPVVPRLEEMETASTDWLSPEDLQPVARSLAEQKPYQVFLTYLARRVEETWEQHPTRVFESPDVIFIRSDNRRRTFEYILDVKHLATAKTDERVWNWVYSAGKAMYEMWVAQRPMDRYAGLDLDYYRSRIERDQFDLLKQFVGAHPASEDFDPTDLWYP